MNIEKDLIFWTQRGIVTNETSEEIQNVIKEYSEIKTPAIEKEISRMFHEKLIRTPQERLKIAKKLKRYEAVKQVDYSDDDFWNLMSVDGLENQKRLKEELNNVSPSFCLAKWNQVTIHLQNGTNHSCHHPAPHQIPYDELRGSPSALHNTRFKKQQRKLMLNGKRPPECDYCWNVEDSNPDAFSDRIMKSGEGWAFPYFHGVKNSDSNEDVIPSYVEISFSNQCNMACGYCDVKSSSKWQSEIEKLGGYPTSKKFNDTEWLKTNGIYPTPYTQPNPYRDAFWKWWPDLFPKLHTFRITGGEPLIQKDTFKVLDYIIDNPKINPQLELSVNSNLSGPQDMVDEFFDKVKYICDKDLVWNFGLFTSIESYGEHAEYMRDGLDTNKFWNNIETFLEKVEKASVTIMSTYNLTSIFSFDKVIERVVEYKRKYYNYKRYRHYACMLDIAYIREPEFLQIRNLPTNLLDLTKGHLNLMHKHSEEHYSEIYKHGHMGFYDFEREKLRRMIDWAESPIEDVEWLIRQRKDFVAFIDEFDKRRNKNFLQTFPQFENFYNSCKSL